MSTDDQADATVAAKDLASRSRPDASAARVQVEASERHEAAELRTLGRRIWPIPVIAWPLFVLGDLRFVLELYPSELMASLVARGCVWLAFIAIWAAWRSKLIFSRRQMLTLATLMSVTTNIGLGFVASRMGGLESYYAPGAMLAVVPYIYLAVPWRSGVAPVALTALAYVVTVVAGVALRPDLAWQLHSARSTAIFGNMVGLFTGVVVMAVAGGHLVWSLRRQVFETRSIGRYQLRRRLGVGGMGEVWAAWHSGLKRLVALKLIRDGAQEPVAIRRLEREVAALGELSHPNTVRVFDYGTTDDGLWFYAMELLEGVTLHALIEREGPQSPARCLRFATQTARALAEAHARGIVHRDVKPENLFVTNAGGEPDFIKLLDFGIARMVAGEPSAALTSTGSIAGTPQYISPEAIGGLKATPATDVYSVGGVMYFTLTGTPPFLSASVAGVLAAQLLEAPESPSARIGAAIPEDIEAVVMKCLAKRPDDRFKDGAELAEALALCSVAAAAHTTLASKGARSVGAFVTTIDSPLASRSADRSG